jgi:hypothetical protein
VDIRIEVVYLLTLRWPVTMVLAKATWRYYSQLRERQQTSRSSPLAQATQWAQGQDMEGYTI